MRCVAYHRPTSVDEAVGLLSELGESAAVLGGGTWLMNRADPGRAGPAHLVSLAAIPELRGVRGSAHDGVALGAMTSLREVETSPVVRRAAPGLAEAAGHVSTVRIRNQATVGGNLAHPEPNQDLPPMLMVHDAIARTTGPAGSRDVPVSEMYAGLPCSAVRQDEVLVSVRVPPVPSGTRTGYLKLLPRTRYDASTVSVAASLTIVDGRVERARIAVAGGGSPAARCREAESVLVSAGLDEGSAQAAAATVPGCFEPVSDPRGSAHYKRSMACVCTERLLHRLMTQAIT